MPDKKGQQCCYMHTSYRILDQKGNCEVNREPAHISVASSACDFDQTELSCNTDIVIIGPTITL